MPVAPCMHLKHYYNISPHIKGKYNLGPVRNYTHICQMPYYLVEALLTLKLVHGQALLTDKMTGMASMTVKRYQGWKCEISLLELPHLVEPLARMPRKETTLQDTWNRFE